MMDNLYILPEKKNQIFLKIEYTVFGWTHLSNQVCSISGQGDVLPEKRTKNYVDVKLAVDERKINNTHTY